MATNRLTVDRRDYQSLVLGVYRSRVPCVESGSYTSTVTLRVVGGDDKGSLKSETVKYGY
jgi:hypothetical protein